MVVIFLSSHLCEYKIKSDTFGLEVLRNLEFFTFIKNVSETIVVNQFFFFH